MPKAKIISVAMQKGGTGKTTTAINLAAFLAMEENMRVLLVDADPQCNASQGVGYTQPQPVSLYDALLHDRPLKECILSTRFDRLEIVAGSLDLASADIDLSAVLAREHLLERSLAPVLDDYDFVVIDCPPQLGMLTVNAFTASDFILIPLTAETFPLKAIARLEKTASSIQQFLNPRLTILGPVMQMFDGRMNLSRSIYNEIQNHFRERAFESVIYRSVRVPESQAMGEPLVVYAPNERVTESYRDLAKEVLQRVSHISAQEKAV